MREFLQVLRRFVPPYKKYLAWSVFFNILSAVLNIFSFMTLIPILQILFNTKDVTPVEKLITWDSVHGVESMVDMLTNNVNYYIQHNIAIAIAKQYSIDCPAKKPTLPGNSIEITEQFGIYYTIPPRALTV